MAIPISPLRYPGGKSGVARKLVALFPEFDEYREPFLGGGSVFIQAKRCLPTSDYWVNDRNSNLYWFWKAVKDSPNELVEEIHRLRNKFRNGGRDLYTYLRKEYDPHDAVQIATRFFILNRITYSGLTESGGFSNESFQKRFTQSSIERLENVSTLLQHVKLTNLDFVEVLESPGKNVFLFLDPPYYSLRNANLYGKNGNLNTQFNHLKFAEVVRNTNHKWMITYDGDPFIEDLYKDYKPISWSIQYGMVQKEGNSRKNNELIITNFDISTYIKSSTIPLLND